MSEAIKSAKDRMLTLLTVDKELRKMNFDEFESMPKEYVELRVAFDKVTDSEYGRSRGIELEKATSPEDVAMKITKQFYTPYTSCAIVRSVPNSQQAWEIIEKVKCDLKDFRLEPKLNDQIKIKVEVDTSELDEAIVKTKILNDELEKAKRMINDLEGTKKSESPTELVAFISEQLRRDLRG